MKHTACHIAIKQMADCTITSLGQTIENNGPVKHAFKLTIKQSTNQLLFDTTKNIML